MYQAILLSGTLLPDARLLPVMNVHQKEEFVLPWNAIFFALTCTNVTTNATLLIMVTCVSTFIEFIPFHKVRPQDSTVEAIEEACTPDGIARTTVWQCGLHWTHQSSLCRISVYDSYTPGIPTWLVPYSFLDNEIFSYKNFVAIIFGTQHKTR